MSPRSIFDAWVANDDNNTTSAVGAHGNALLLLPNVEPDWVRALACLPLPALARREGEKQQRRALFAPSIQVFAPAPHFAFGETISPVK